MQKVIDSKSFFDTIEDVERQGRLAQLAKSETKRSSYKLYRLSENRVENCIKFAGV